MSVVDYPSSSSESEAPSPPSISVKQMKRKRTQPGVQVKITPSSYKSTSLPPLPSTFHDLYVAAARISTHDDPSLHGGRQRVDPHIEGKWPTHIYLEWYPSSTELLPLSLLLSTPNHSPAHTDPTIHSLLTNDLSVPLPLHISLSRPLSLSTSQRQPFLDKLTHSLKTSRAHPFTVNFTGLDWSANESLTRWFLVLRVSRPENDDLNRLLSGCNGVAAEFAKPALYHDVALAAGQGDAWRRPGSGRLGRGAESVSGSGILRKPSDGTDCFHVSIGWVLEAPPQGDEQCRSLELTEDISKINVNFDTIKVKMGNTVTSISLSPEVMDSKGILG